MGISNARCPPTRTGHRQQTSSGADAALRERDWDRTVARRPDLAATRSIATTNSGSRTLATGAAASNAADVGDRLPGNEFTGVDVGGDQPPKAIDPAPRRPHRRMRHSISRPLLSLRP